MTKILHTATITFYSVDGEDNVALVTEMSDQPDADYIPSAHVMASSIVMSLRKNAPAIELDNDVFVDNEDMELGVEDRAVKILSSITPVDEAVAEVL